MTSLTDMPADIVEAATKCAMRFSSSNDSHWVAFIAEALIAERQAERQAERDRCNEIVRCAWGDNVSLEAFAARGWQPIATAPKDGTKFLAFEIGEHFNCWWHDNGYGEQYWMDEADTEPNPTHWQPLPSPPKGS